MNCYWGCNYEGMQALCCEMVVLFYVCQPNHNYVDFIFKFMFSLHRDILHMLQVCYTTQCLIRTTQPREHPTVLFSCLWPHSFLNHVLESICLASTTCYDILHHLTMMLIEIMQDMALALRCIRIFSSTSRWSQHYSEKQVY